MPLEILIIQQPHEVNFSGNALAYNLAVAPYGTAERSQDIRVQLRVEVEAALNSGLFTEIRNQVIFPDAMGKVQVDINSIADAFLHYHTPRLTLARPLRADKQRRRFRITVLLQQNGALVGDPVVSNIIHVIKGGLAYEQFHYSEFFTNVIVTQKKPLHFFTGKEFTSVDEYKFLYWIYPHTLVADLQNIKFVLTMDDASTVTYTMAATISPNKWGIFFCPVGFTQANLAAQVPVGRTCVSYTVSVLCIPGSPDPDVIIVDPVTFIMDYRKYYDSKQLLYTNSTGGMDTIRILGEIDTGADYTTNNADRIVPTGGMVDAILQPQSIAANNEETEKFIGNTNFVPKEKVSRLRDLLLSKNVFEIREGKLIPVLINKRNIKFFTNKDGLVGMAIEWVNAFANRFYTPHGLLPTGRTCPAMLNLQVKQVSKNKLQIMWAMPMPYDTCEIEIDTGVPPVQKTTLIGNSGSQVVNFINPATYPDPEDITIKARVVCDPYSDPQDTGPWTTVVISVVADTLPVANDDTYTLAAGFNTPQTFAASTLANDYDPDGDAIEVIAVTGGTTDAGGTYDIDAAGIVTFTPVTSIYNGIDFFDYTIRQVVNTALQATARVYLRVGDTTLGNNTFVRLSYENEYGYGGTGETHIGAEIFIKFFADPLGTIPKDVSSLGLTMNYRITNTELTDAPSPPGNTYTVTPADYTIAGTSIKTLIWSLGDYFYMLEDPPTGTVYVYWSNYFTLLPGTGYIII